MNKILKNKKNVIGTATLESMESNSENEIRRMLDEWSKNRVNLQSGFGTGMDIEKISVFSQYRCSMSLMKVIRNITEKESPNRLYEESDSSNDPFDYNYDLPENYENGKSDNFVMLSTVTTHECPTTIRCSKCNGSGDCSSCKGQGETRCSTCHGNTRCQKCAGSGWDSGSRKCIFCFGSGSCSSCKGSGYKSCFWCNGKGKCSKCEGSGELICGRCNGSGCYQQYSSVSTEFKVEKKSFYSNLVDFFNNTNKLDSVSGKIIFDNDLFVYADQNSKEDYFDQLEIITDKNAEFVKYSEGDFLKYFNISEGDNSKLGKLKLVTEYLYTNKVDYIYEGNNFTMYLVCNTNDSFYIFYDKLPKLSFKEVFFKIFSNILFYINPFINKNRYNKKIKYFTYLGILHLISTGKKDPKEVEVLTNFINSAPIDEKIKKTLLLDLNKNNTVDNVKNIIEKIKLSDKTKEEALFFVYTLSSQINQSDASVAKNESDTLHSFADKLGLDESINKDKLLMKNVNEKAKTNARLLSNSVFDNYFVEYKTVSWVLKFIIQLILYPLAIYKLVSLLNMFAGILSGVSLLILLILAIFLDIDEIGNKKSVAIKKT